MKKTFLIIGIMLLGVQLIRPDFTNPQIEPTHKLQADGEVMGILKNACYDCHSNETQYPWYSNIAPVSWLMADHIKDGREAINFSNWSNIDPARRVERLKRANHLMHLNMMPIGNYTWMHEKAKLSDEQKNTLKDFFDKQIQELKKS